MAKRPLSLSLLLLLLAIPSAAQYPRPPRALLGWFEIASHLATTSFTRTKFVGPGGDFKTLHDACAYVAAQSPTALAWWRIIVLNGPPATADGNGFGGNYTETTLTVPPYTSIEGSPASSDSFVAGQPIIAFTGTSGGLLNLGAGSQISGLTIYWAKTPTGVVKVVRNNTGGEAFLSRVKIIAVPGSTAFETDAVVNDSGSLYMNDVDAETDGASASSSTVVNSDAASGIAISGGRYVGAGLTALVRNTSTGVLKLFWSRLDAGATFDVKNASTGTIEVHATDYQTSSGLISNGTSHAPYGTTTPSACSPGALFVNSTSGAPTLAACTATDTQKAAPLLGTCKVLEGAGSPEGVITAPICSLYLRTDGSTSTTLYVKTTGAGNTGWTAK